jgi:hypothetical protein
MIISCLYVFLVIVNCNFVPNIYNNMKNYGWEHFKFIFKLKKSFGGFNDYELIFGLKITKELNLN